MLASTRTVREIPLAPAGWGAGRPAVWLAEPDTAVSIAADGLDRAVFEGVLHNREEAAAAAGLGPEVEDADIVLGAYRRWGEDSLRRLKGRFALCVWDGGAGTLFCARDPMGHHPLFYADAGGAMLLSSSSTALVAHSAVSRDVDRRMCAEFLAHQWVDSQQTWFAAVRRVPPGHAMRIGPGGRRLCRHWDPVPPGRRMDWGREDEFTRFDELFDQAVARCLQPGPAGVNLSGGLDSAAVAATAADVSRRMRLPAPWALSLAFPHPECNEEATQRKVAAALGLPQIMLPVQEAVHPRGFLLSLLDMGAEWPFPTWFVWRPAYHRLAREAALRGCRVIVTGGGGDDWLTVDSILAADLLRGLKVAELFRLVANLRRSYTAGPGRLLYHVLWEDGARPWVRLAAVRALRGAAPGLLRARRRRRITSSIPRWVAPDPALRREIEERGATGIADPEPGPDGFYVSTARSLLDHPLRAMEAEETFEAGRRSGVPEMEPFRDADLVDFLYRVPPALLNHGGRSKAPIRQMLARRFPGLGFERQKKVQATAYLAGITLAEGPRAWKSLGGAKALAQLGVLDEEAFAGETEAILSGGRGREVYRILDVMTLEAWVRPRL